MKSFASGNYGSKFWQEIALDYGLPHRSDLLSRVGVRSKHNRLLYAVGMLALACILVLAIWATGNSMQMKDDMDVRSIPSMRKFGPPPDDADVEDTAEVEDEQSTPAAAEGPDYSTATAKADSGSSSSDTGTGNKTASSSEQQKSDVERHQQQQPVKSDDGKDADAAAESSGPAGAGAAAAGPATPAAAANTSTSSSSDAQAAAVNQAAEQPPAVAAASPAAGAEVVNSNSTAGR